MTLFSLHKDEKGSAMSEFIITLPIFIIIFSGMGSLYQLHRRNLHTIKEANYELWKSSEDMSIVNWSPLSGGVQELYNYKEKTAWSNISSVASIGGIYAESYAQTIIPSVIPGSNITPKYTIKDITGLADAGSPSRKLLNDQFNVSGLSGGGGVISTVLDIALGLTGSSLAIGAGIRYGEIKAEHKPDPLVVTGVTYTPEPLTLFLPVNTSATHRLFPVALTRLRHMEEPLKSAILKFETGASNSSVPNWVENSEQPVEYEDEDKKECIEQIQKERAEHTECVNYQKALLGHEPNDLEKKQIAEECENLEPDESCLT